MLNNQPTKNVIQVWIGKNRAACTGTKHSRNCSKYWPLAVACTRFHEYRAMWPDSQFLPLTPYLTLLILPFQVFFLWSLQSNFPSFSFPPHVLTIPLKESFPPTDQLNKAPSYFLCHTSYQNLFFCYSSSSHSVFESNTTHRCAYPDLFNQRLMKEPYEVSNWVTHHLKVYSVISCGQWGCSTFYLHFFFCLFCRLPLHWPPPHRKAAKVVSLWNDTVCYLRGYCTPG